MNPRESDNPDADIVIGPHWESTMPRPRVKNGPHQFGFKIIRRRLEQFADHGFDGMRCDVDGYLYVTRYGKGTVVKLSPTGEILTRIIHEAPSASSVSPAFFKAKRTF